MFKKLDLYIFKKFISTFIFVLILFIFIIIVFDFAERVDDFIDKEAPISAILFDYYLNFVPYFVNMFSPLFIFIAAIYFTSRMATDSEIVAILSSGISFYRILVPYIVTAVMLASLSYYLNGYVIPVTNKKMVEFEMKYLRDGFDYRASNIHRQTSPGEFIYMQSYNNQDSTAYQFALERFEYNELVYKLRASRARWDGKKEQWLARHYTFREIKGMQEKLVSGDSMYLSLNLHPDDFGRLATNIQMMTNKQLEEYIDLQKMRGDDNINFLLVERYKRDSLPFATFILVLLAVAISSRKVRGGMGLHIGLGILLAFSYLVILQFSTTFAINANFNALIAVWVPNLMYLVIAIILVYKAPK